ncbi:MAG TPA: CoA transferase [Dehalococcoidia bacterium]|nr:CoA transferase [Dehalococcoidia bacterium]
MPRDDSVLSPQSTVRRLPLEGLRVLDVTVVWAGPHSTQLLAEWGAEVIRVEPLKHIQPATRGAENRMTKAATEAMRGNGLLLAGAFPDRDPGERPWNRSPVFNSHAHNKRSVTLDIMEPSGLDVFKQLVAISDVVVENNAPDTIERAKITYEELAAVNPRLIMLRISAFGLSGPYKYYRNYGTQIEAAIGHHLIRSYPDLEPTMTGEAYTADASGGVQGALAVMLALRHLRRTGQGQLIELSLAECFMPYLGEIILDYTMNGRALVPQGNQHSSRAPHGVYPCHGDDRWIAIDVGSDAEWEALCGALSMAGWMEDERFATGLTRWHHRAALDEALAKRTVNEDAFELFRRLQAVGVTAGPVQNEADVYACPQLAARDFFQQVSHPDAGDHLYPGFNVRLEETPNSFRRPACLLGQDNDYVYHDLLNVSDSEYERLEALGHIGTAYPGYYPATAGSGGG